jgi:hypothetical protein
MSPDALNSLFSLCIGFALAGALASGYQAMVQRPAGFGLLQEGVVPKALAAVPFLVFAAPFIIMRNTLRGARIERRRFQFVMMATMLAGFWSEPETDWAWRSTNSTGRRPKLPRTETFSSPTPPR